MNINDKRSYCGITLIELVVVLVILTVIGAVASPAFLKSHRRYTFDRQVRNIYSNLRQMREYSISRNEEWIEGEFRTVRYGFRIVPDSESDSPEYHGGIFSDPDNSPDVYELVKYVKSADGTKWEKHGILGNPKLFFDDDTGEYKSHNNQPFTPGDPLLFNCRGICTNVEGCRFGSDLKLLFVGKLVDASRTITIDSLTGEIRM